MTRTRRQAVTIKHVAAEAGVSLQTVSRVINNEPNVRQVVIDRVKEAVAKLGYVPSMAARRLGGSRSYILLALNDRDRTIEAWKLREGTDWVDQMLLGGMLKCAEHGYRMMFELIDTHSDHIDRELSAALASVRPDGVILTPPHSDNPAIIDLLQHNGVAFARIGSETGGPGFCLSMGDRGGARLATEHLIELGHQQIGFIAGSDEYAQTPYRVSGYRDALMAAGIDAQEDLIFQGDFSYESGVAGAKALLARQPRVTAIFAGNDQMALGTLDAARQVGLRVPEDLSVVSFDDTPIVRFGTPSLTAVTQPVAEVTARAAELLIDANAGRPVPEGQVTLESGLAKRDSTAAPSS